MGEMNKHGQGGTLDHEEPPSSQPESEAVAKAKKRVKGGTTTCYVIAGLGFLGAVLILAMQDQLAELGLDSTAGVIVLVLAALFLGLGLWSRKKPYPALLIAMVVYGINAILTIVNYMNAGGGAGGLRFIIIGVILGLLIRGFMGASRLKKIQAGG